MQIYSNFIFFRVIFICVAYLFILTVCLMSSSSILLRAKSRISYLYLNTILFFSITSIYVKNFWLYYIFMKRCGDVEKTPDLNLALTKFSPFAIEIWTVFLRTILSNSLFQELTYPLTSLMSFVYLKHTLTLIHPMKTPI